MRITIEFDETAAKPVVTAPADAATQGVPEVSDVDAGPAPADLSGVRSEAVSAGAAAPAADGGEKP